MCCITNRLFQLVLLSALFSPEGYAAPGSGRKGQEQKSEQGAPAKSQKRAKPQSQKDQKIIYRVISNTQAYDRASRGQHLSIKVTPPTKMGPQEFVYIEIYNYTKTNIAYMEFSITLSNNRGYDLSTKITADAIDDGWSALRKIPTPGKGPFPPITKVRISNLRAVNADASTVYLPAYVDLVRVNAK